MGTIVVIQFLEGGQQQLQPWKRKKWKDTRVASQWGGLLPKSPFQGGDWGVSEHPSHRGCNLSQRAKRYLSHTFLDFFKDILEMPAHFIRKKGSVSKTRNHLSWTSGNQVQLLLHTLPSDPVGLKGNGTKLRAGVVMWSEHLKPEENYHCFLQLIFPFCSTLFHNSGKLYWRVREQDYRHGSRNRSVKIKK